MRLFIKIILCICFCILLVVLIFSSGNNKAYDTIYDDLLLGANKDVILVKVDGSCVLGANAINYWNRVSENILPDSVVLKFVFMSRPIDYYYKIEQDYISLNGKFIFNPAEVLGAELYNEFQSNKIEVMVLNNQKKLVFAENHSANQNKINKFLNIPNHK